MTKDRVCMKSRKRKIGFLFILPHLIGVSIFFIIPYFNVIRLSFTSIAGGIGLNNYEKVLNNQAFRLALFNSLKFIATSTPVIIISSLLLAQVLKKQGLFQQLMKRCYLVPMALPVVGIAFFWQILFDSQGFLNSFFHMMGVESIDWMGSDWAFYILVISYTWKNLGYYIILWLAAMSAIPDELYEAAKIDRATEIQCFRYITLPFLRNALYMILVLSLVNAFKVFREAYLVAGAYPHKSMYLIQHLFNNWFQDLDIEKMAAGAVLNGLIIILLVVVLRLIAMKEALS